MTEPNKIFRSEQQDSRSYSDTCFSKLVECTMTTFSKKLQFGTLIFNSVIILGSLIIFIFFVIIGLSLYPHLVGDCRSDLEQHKSEEGAHDDHLAFFSKILRGLGICRENDDISRGIVEFHIGKMNISGNNESWFLDKVVCKCPRKKSDELRRDIEKGNNKSSVEFSIYYECACNEMQEVEDFKIIEEKNKSVKNHSVLLNVTETNHTDYRIESDEMKEIHYLNLSTCNCSNVSRIDNASLNEDQFGEIECKCSDVHNTTMDGDETKSVIEQHHDKFVDNRYCHCPNMHKEQHTILNGSESGNEKFNFNLTTGEDCICPETIETDDIIKNETLDEKKKDFIETLDMEVDNHTDNFNFHEPEVMNEGESFKNKTCICPNLTQNATNGIFNKTQASEIMHSNKFTENKECKCPQFHETDNFNLHETQVNDDHSLNTEKCECSPESNVMYNETIVKKFGIKNINGECVCADTEGIDDSSVSKIINGSFDHNNDSLNTKETFVTPNFYFNETENDNEMLSQSNDQCVCPKSHEGSDASLNGRKSSDQRHDFELKQNKECKCPPPDILEINNYDLYDSENYEKKSGTLKPQECLCPQTQKLLENGSRVENNNVGFKDADGKCICREAFDLDKVPGNESKTVNKEEITTGYKSDALNKEEMTNINPIKTVNENPLVYDDEKEIPNAKMIFNSGQDQY